MSDKELAADSARVAQKLGTATLSRSVYSQHGRFSQYDIHDGGRTWEQLCSLAGVACMKSEPVPDEVYFQRLASAIAVLGRSPQTGERKKFGLNFSKRRYPNLTTFIDRAADLGFIEGSFRSRAPAPPSPPPSGSFLGTQPPPGRPVPPIPRNTKRARWERTGVSDFPYASQDELGVVALFGMLCATGAIEWQIVEMRGGKGIDVTCFDHVMQ